MPESADAVTTKALTSSAKFWPIQRETAERSKSQLQA